MIYKDYSKIKNVKGRGVFDSQGFATIEVEIELEDGTISKASAPRGSTKGNFEAKYIEEYIRGIHKSPDISKAISIVEEVIKPEIVGKNVLEISKIDEILIKLDTSKNKQNIGGNCTLAVSYAVLKAAALYLKTDMYKLIGERKVDTSILPMVNIIDGSKHPKSNLKGIEVLILPTKAENIFNTLNNISNIVYTLKDLLWNKGYIVEISNQGALSILVNSVEECIEFVLEAINNEGFIPGEDFNIGLDLATTDYYDINNKIYKLPWIGEIITTDKLIEIYSGWIKKYPIKYIEDGFADQDYDGWKKFYDKFSNEIIIAGDDLYATNLERLKKCLDLANGIVIKPNQVGTLLETLDVIKFAAENKFTLVTSQRTGETDDVILAHLAFSQNIKYLKAGGILHMDRIAKYNELIRLIDKNM